MNYPEPRQIWQHQKHRDDDPAKWYEYKIVGVTNPEAYVQGHAIVPDGVAKHTESGEILDIAYSGTATLLIGKGFSMLDEPHVIYQNICPDIDPTIWARPLNDFMGQLNG